jgi:signal transduction histidine kinase
VCYFRSPFMHSLARYLDPRRSLASAIGWLVFALSIGLVLVASVLVGDIVRTNLLDQRDRQLDRTADRIAAELNLSIALRLQSVRALAAVLATELRDQNAAALRTVLENLQQASPELAWIGVANPRGRVLAATQGVTEGASIADQSWFASDPSGPSVGEVRLVPFPTKQPPAAAGDTPRPVAYLIASAVDTNGVRVGVVAAQLGARWLADLARGLGSEQQGSAGTEALLLDENGAVLIGPASRKGQRWESAPESADAAGPTVAGNLPVGRVVRPSRVERLPDGSRYLVARAKPTASDALHTLGWEVVVLQPMREATQDARALQNQIAAVLVGLGLLAASLGVLVARRVARHLEAIARSADDVRTGAAQSITVPPGRNEAARLGRALDELLTSLQRERGALQTLNAELDQRVAARTREIERLARQAGYDAVVRERLKIARDLHDTLAHSMMAMLTEIRLLKRISATNPAALGEELMRAEETAHQGLKEARAAIAQMRFNPVRDGGLAAALADFVELFVERTGIQVDYTSDAQAGAFADERAETLFRIAEEAMRNVERHAGATRVTISLRASPDGNGLTLTIADDGVGFDAEAAHPGHYGLAGLREQARLIGAALTIRSALQQGTRISVTVAEGLNS